ncbi:MAG TPA: dockerin type I domain-containing protein [Pseudobacteroides sp.]|uniref:dockerin type I domain-containing protein n=1 Tax=Pseudobacteroides sp. TaxID=1968840 RepID=UPI002F91F61A
MRLDLKFKKGIVLMLTVILMLSVPLVVSGEENSVSAKISTAITWTNPINVPVGPTLAGAQGLTISLSDINGNPLKNKPITWDAQSVYVENRTTTTNEDGISQNVFYVAHADRNATYTATIAVRFAGDDTYEKSQYIMSIKCYDYGPPTPVTSTPEPPIQTPGTPSTASPAPTTPTAPPPTPVVSMPCTDVPVSPISGYPTINKNQFLFVDAHIYKEGRGNVGPGMMIDFPTYTYSAANKMLTSYIEVANYNANTNVIIGSGTSITGTAGGGAATRLNAYNTYAYEGLYYFDSNLTVHFFMNGAWRTVAVGEEWAETIEQKTETGGVFLITYTINNYGLHEKGRFMLPISSITPTVSPIPTPTAAKKFKLCGFIKPEPEGSNKSSYAGFKVEIPSLGISVLTNPLGYYEFNDLPERSHNIEYTIKVTKPGYLTNTVPYIAFIEDTEVGSIEQPIFMYSGDVNADGSINMSDIMGIAKAFNNTVNDALFNEAADLNDDNVVNMMDVIIVAKNFNRLESDYPEPSIMYMEYISAKVDDNIQIALNEGGIAGITWIYKVVSGDSNIKFVSKTTGTIPYPDAFARSTWTFKALSAGTTTVIFDSSYGVDMKYFINITKKQ